MKVQSKLGVTIPKPYSVYTALITQSGYPDPVATVLENTLSGPIVWTISTNRWIGTLAGAFTAGKTFIQASGPEFLTTVDTLRVLHSSPNTVEIWGTEAGGGTNSLDTLTGYINVEIRVYP